MSRHWLLENQDNVFEIEEPWDVTGRDKKALQLEERYHRPKETGLGMLRLMEGKEKRNIFLL